MERSPGCRPPRLSPGVRGSRSAGQCRRGWAKSPQRALGRRLRRLRRAADLLTWRSYPSLSWFIPKVNKRENLEGKSRGKIGKSWGERLVKFFRVRNAKEARRGRIRRVGIGICRGGVWKKSVSAHYREKSPSGNDCINARTTAARSTSARRRDSKRVTIFRGRGTASRVPRGTSGSGVDKYSSQHLRMDTAALSGVRNSEERISCG